MNDVYQKLAGAVRLWQIEEAANVSSDIDVTEAWYSHDTDRVTVQDHHVVAAELSEWLQRTTRPSNTGVKTLVMRLVWVRVDPEKRHFSVSKPTRKALLKAFGLGLAYDYFQSFVTGVTKFPEETTAYGPREAYAFSYAPKLAAIWSSSYRPPPFRCGTLTQGLIFVREPARSTQLEERVIQTLRESLTHTWDAGLLCHPLFPAYLLALLLGIQIDLTQQGIKKRLQGLEKRTGYHGFASRREEEATGVFQELSVTASGWITKLASVERKSKTIDQLLTLISKQSNTQEKEAINLNSRTERGHGTVSGTVTLDTVHLLKSQTDVLKHRHDMQVLDNQYIVKRVEIQIQALFHLIAREETISSYKLSQHMAQTAEFSYRDAASMKTLAVVTMFFLPGSFVSALFSTQLFAWDDIDQLSNSIGVPTTPQLTLYWAVTIPLTLVTFVLYFLWLWYQKNERKRNFKTDEQMDEAAAARGEGLSNVNRMQTFISEVKGLSHKV